MRVPDRPDARLRVCHVAMGDMWAGAEVQLLALMTYLVRLQGFEWSVVLFNEGRLADELRKLPVAVTVIPEKHHGALAIAYRLAKTFRRIRPNIVHTHKYKDSILSSIVARCMGVPHMVRVIHGMPEPFSGLRNVKMIGYTLIDRFVTGKFFDKVVAVSSDIEKVLVRLYGEARVVVIHNGVDLEAIRVKIQPAEMRKTWQVDARAVLIGTVGRLVPVKGHGVLLEAVKILRESHEHVTLLVVGDGPLRDKLEKESARLGLGESVVFAGHQAQSYDFINMMDIFVLPSLHEGIPMVLLEALALQRPVIASRVGGIPEVVLQGTTGMLVPPADAGALAEGIKTIINDRVKASGFGVAGQGQIEREFSAGMMASRTAGLYRSLCEH